MSKKPLEGIRVLDLTQFLSGPMCTMTLGDAGAEVVKVERPPKGDPTRITFPVHHGNSSYWISVNKGKKSVALDLKRPDHKAVFMELAKQTDVLVENYKPGTAKKMGIDYESIRAINPDIIYLSISGFGQTGPYRDRPALDIAVQAISGLMSITGEKGGSPLRCGTSITDITAGLFGIIGVLTALYHREKTGEGQYIDVAMLEGALAIMENACANYLVNGIVPKPTGNYHTSSAPLQPFDTADGSILVAAPADMMFEKLTQVLGCPELVQDPRFDINAHRFQHVPELEEKLSPYFKKMTTREACELLEDAKIVYGEINTVPQILASEQVKERGVIVDVEDGYETFQVIGSPFKYSTFEMPKHYHAAALGENNYDVLESWLNMSKEEIDAIMEGMELKHDE